MFKFKIFISVIFFSSLLIGTSFIKNKTREIEKKIYVLNKNILHKEKDVNESQLDYSYLTSPLKIEQKVESFISIQYLPMDYSKIFLSINDFVKLESRFADQNKEDEKKIKKK